MQKVKILLVITFFMVSLVLGYFYMVRITSPRIVNVVLPKDYHGIVVIVLDQVNGLDFERKGEKVFLEVPQSGILYSKFDYDLTLFEKKFFYRMGDKILAELKNPNLAQKVEGDLPIISCSTGFYTYSGKSGNLVFGFSVKNISDELGCEQVNKEIQKVIE